MGHVGNKISQHRGVLITTRLFFAIANHPVLMKTAGKTTKIVFDGLLFKIYQENCTPTPPQVQVECSQNNEHCERILTIVKLVSKKFFLPPTRTFLNLWKRHRYTVFLSKSCKIRFPKLKRL